ncbi:hypothetical protein SKTS_24090 [Sulfurimicrobium lacus]|uniref:Transposase IS200-like domain-containing protein n=2 Tax=Sulfurimicrobium lacus TaxID=2715678 RepID=A0A6F8VCF5_9PROT|nr:hypothetical protein SKTS_24090 [Sulfurimicrobium lacus]
MPQHIVQRGINREPCFFAEEDYHSYLHWLERAAVDWHCVVHAYVLMTNHVHLLVSPETETGTAKLMQAIGRRYVQYINRSYRRTGSLWEGRYKSSVIQAETYLLTCMRYIELNPVRAGMVQDPGQYRWSSYRHNGLGQAQGQPLGHGRFSDKICAEAGIRRTQKRPGRPAGKTDQSRDTETQPDFGF